MENSSDPRASELTRKKGAFQPIEKLEVFRLFVKAADEAWRHMEGASPLDWDTFGKQWVKAADSVAANLIEGGDRGTDPDAVRFFVMARASASESLYWLRRAFKRKRLTEVEAKDLVASIRQGLKLLNGLISYRRSKPLKLSEELKSYRAESDSELDWPFD